MEEKKDRQMKFIMFENDDNLCWLDASIALVTHNSTFKKIVSDCTESEINKIISSYNKAITTLNNTNDVTEQEILQVKKSLKEIQTNVLEYLKQYLKFKPGEPDSAFCALYNLIHQDKSNIEDIINISWIWRKECSNCGLRSKTALYSKPIITLSKVDNFHPENPSSIYVCACKSEQEMILHYKELPPCLIFHFENGAGFGAYFPSTFFIKGREYHLTGVTILEKSSETDLKHFVSWIRNPHSNTWLDCNDLNTSFVSFSPLRPEFDLRDVYVYVFESFDNLGKVICEDVSMDDEQDLGITNIEIIDLSDEACNSKGEDKLADKNSVDKSEIGAKSEIPDFQAEVRDNSGPEVNENSNTILFDLTNPSTDEGIADNTLPTERSPKFQNLNGSATSSMLDAENVEMCEKDVSPNIFEEVIAELRNYCGKTDENGLNTDDKVDDKAKNHSKNATCSGESMNHSENATGSGESMNHSENATGSGESMNHSENATGSGESRNHSENATMSDETENGNNSNTHNSGDNSDEELKSVIDRVVENTFNGFLSIMFQLQKENP